MTFKLEYSVSTASRKGHKETNEDSCFAMLIPTCFEPLQVAAAVFDGVGGENAGDVASAIAANTFRESIALAYSPVTKVEAVSAEVVLGDAIKIADARIAEDATIHAERVGMGTTCAAILIADNTLFVAHLGDSRAYVFRDGRTEFSTKDHALLTSDVDTGSQPGALTNWLGGMGFPPSIAKMELLPGDRIVVCSDGLYGAIGEEQISRGIENSAAASAESLIRYAEQFGAEDDVTVAVIWVTQEAETPVAKNASDVPLTQARDWSRIVAVATLACSAISAGLGLLIVYLLWSSGWF